MAETFANDAVGNLGAAMAVGDTSLVLEAGQGGAFPATGDFRIEIDSELILVGARSGDTLESLTRGIEGTAAAAHNTGALVEHLLTAGALAVFVQDFPVGAVIMGSTATPDPGWALCDGSARKRTGLDPGDGQDYSALATKYAAEGFRYGAGDGATTFNLPDARGRMPFGLGTAAGVNALGLNEGQGNVNARRPQHRTSFSDPTHAHSVPTYTGGGTGDAPSNIQESTGGAGLHLVGYEGTLASGTGVVVGTNNGNDPLDTSPFLVFNFFVKL